ncbi:MAG: hypothetical protein ACLUUO_09605 [Sellimonas intestinalis]
MTWLIRYVTKNQKECIQIEDFNRTLYENANNYNSTIGYNNAAGILADKNHFPGIDISKVHVKNISRDS